MAYAEDREWSDRFIPTIKAIVGPHVLMPSSIEIDRTEATDLLVFTARDLRIAARVRRHEWVGKYGREFTIRSRVKSGADTELQKIIEGWGDLLFYGFAESDDAVTINPWYLIDLKAFRRYYSERVERGVRFKERSTRDNSAFLAFEIDTFQGSPPLLIAQSTDATNADALRMSEPNRLEDFEPGLYPYYPEGGKGGDASSWFWNRKLSGPRDGGFAYTDSLRCPSPGCESVVHVVCNLIEHIGLRFTCEANHEFVLEVQEHSGLCLFGLRVL